MKKLSAIIVLYLFIFSILNAQDDNLRRSIVLNGNKIKVETRNHGSFSGPGNVVSDFVWHGLGYTYEINFFIGAEVEVPPGSHPDVIEIGEGSKKRYIAHIISDGLKSIGGEYSPDAQTRWGWAPIITANSGYPTYLRQDTDKLLPTSYGFDKNLDGVPDFWPDTWWSQGQEDYLWPGLWAPGRVVTDLETLYGMDDRDNQEFEYYPFPADSSRRGLGVEVETRVFQVQDFYEDILFATYTLNNISDKNLEKMLFGIWGDPHIGGFNDYRDDLISADPEQNLLYCWDDDGFSINNPSIIPAHFGIVFIQTPGNDKDSVDNDGDGMTDESQHDGIDNDHDWNQLTDDIGRDGLAGTGDPGEGDGSPTPGEPNFEFKDADEADQIGLTSLSTPLFSNIQISDDEGIWQYLTPNEFSGSDIPGDNVLLAGSGYFNLKKGQKIKIGIAFVFGKDKRELYLNTAKAKRLYAALIGSQTSMLIPEIISPQKNTINENTINLQWDHSKLPANAKLELAYSTDNGKYWKAAVDEIENTGSFQWEVSNLPNSVFYKIRLRAIHSSAYGITTSPGFFTINHSGNDNVAPEVLLDLEDSVILSGEKTITWFAGDADNDDLSLKLIISSNVVSDTIEVSGNAYTLNSKAYPNNEYKLMLVASDGLETANAERKITMHNAFPIVSDNLVKHSSGHATGALFVEIVNKKKMRRTFYNIFINDTATANLKYSVFDSLNKVFIINDEPLPEYPVSGNTFDGLRLSFSNDKFEFNEELSGWNETSSTNLKMKISRQSNYQYDPHDYQIEFYDDIADTTITNVLVNFKVYDIINEEYMTLASSQSDKTWIPGDSTYPIYILRGGVSYDNIVWRMITSFPDSGQQIYPGAGNIYYIKTTKPFSGNDRYTINTLPLSVSGDNLPVPDTPRLFQNYPNPFNNSTIIKFWLPEKDLIELGVFDILGQKISTICKKELASGYHTFIWNGKNRNGDDVASGLYFYRFYSSKKTLTKKLIFIK